MGKPSIYTLVLVVVLFFFVLAVTNVSERFVDAANEKDSFTMYYVPWCRFSQTLKPEFETFAKAGVIRITVPKRGDTAVNVTRDVLLRLVDVEKQPELVRMEQLKKYPTLRFKASDGSVVDYNGPRNANAYSSFLTNQIKRRYTNV